MRNHEYYFKSLEGGATPLQPESTLMKTITEEFGSFDAWLARFKAIALTRGIGWAMLYYDKTTGRLLNAWIDEQHLGHLTGLSPVLALDVWEHAFIPDYKASGKKAYVEDFFKNLNWSVIDGNLLKAKNN
jgi:Fe-Mn family superoxide dismutase